MAAMTSFTILLGGHAVITPRLKAQVAGSRVIAADSGMAHAAELGVEPEVWVGDFDSSNAELTKAYAHVPRLQFPTAKDATDGEIAITEAFRRGATSLILVGGFGGQADHSLAHVMQLVELSSRGAAVILTSGNEEAHYVNEELILTGLPEGTRLSIIPISNLKGLSISNVRWPLVNRDVLRGSTLTLSNETTGDPHVAIKSGEAIVVVYPS
jgi:thiamine pyrophosphokinase